ncbi:MAG: anthranilate synthase component II [Planctomycetota bacterium]|jgi:anthranilate synthase/aminodeoxychorismate synthase-like glutamine amidotransferase
MAKILVLDNYDSFTYNLVQALGDLGAEVEVRRNDALTAPQVERLSPDRIVLSPGPKRPEETGVCADVVRRCAGRLPILGVCIGHQVIAWALGGRVVRADRVVHGKTSLIHHDGRGVYRSLPSPFEAMRYHSLIVDGDTLPGGLEATARSEHGELMGLRHREWPLEGVQFHPESYRTEVGVTLLRNFLTL